MRLKEEWEGAKNKGERCSPPLFLFESWRGARVGSHRCPVLRVRLSKYSIHNRKMEKRFDFCDGADSPLSGERIPAAPCQLDVSPGPGHHGQACS